MIDPNQNLIEAQRAFLPPAGVGTSRPRDVSLTAAGWAVTAGALALLAAAGVIFVTLLNESARQFETRRSLSAQGVDATAEVVRLWRRSDQEHQPRVAYRWNIGDRSYEGEAKIRLQAWQTLAVGEPIAIRYVPSDRPVSVLAGTEPSVLPAFLAPLASIGVLVLAGACVVRLRADRRLLSEGRVAPAIVTAHKKSGTSRSGQHRSIVYQFAQLTGAVVTATSAAPRKIPAIGSRIVVLYAPDEPQRSRLYPLSLVRVRSDR